MCWSSYRSMWDVRERDAVRAPDPGLRVSDHDRQQVVEQLSKHTGEGRLTLEEFEARVDEVWHASKQAELQHALRELPVPRTQSPRPRARAAEPLLRFAVFVAIMLGLAALAGTWVVWVAVGLWFFRGGPRHRRNHRARFETAEHRREQLTHV